MKIRLGFVSNSSSSSFVCDICDQIESGMDASLSDFEMSMCVNGHEFHNECAKLDIDEMKETIDKKKYLIDNIKESTWYTNKEERIKEVEESDEDDLENAFHDVFIDKGVPEEFCPICSMKEIDGDDMTNYLLKKFNLSKESILTEVKEKFQTYKLFKEYLKGETK